MPTGLELAELGLKAGEAFKSVGTGIASLKPNNSQIVMQGMARKAAELRKAVQLNPQDQTAVQGLQQIAEATEKLKKAPELAKVFGYAFDNSSGKAQREVTKAWSKLRNGEKLSVTEQASLDNFVAKGLEAPTGAVLLEIVGGDLSKLGRKEIKSIAKGITQQAQDSMAGAAIQALGTTEPDTLAKLRVAAAKGDPLAQKALSIKVGGEKEDKSAITTYKQVLSEIESYDADGNPLSKDQKKQAIKDKIKELEDFGMTVTGVPKAMGGTKKAVVEASDDLSELDAEEASEEDIRKQLEQLTE